MKALVTGGAGFLGQNLVKELTAKSYEVTSLSRHKHQDLDELNIPQIQADISNEESLEKIDFSSFDVVFHVAAIAGVWGKKSNYYNVNYIGTKNLFNKVKKDGVRYFIYTSTPSVVFEDDDIINGDESLDYPKKFLTDYAQTKSMAEDFVLSNLDEAIQGLAIRPHLIWGPGDPHILPRLVEKAKAGKLKRVGSGDNLVDIIYVRNAALAHLWAFEALKENSDLNKQAYFIGQERPVKLWDFINQLLTMSSCDPVDEEVSFSTAYKIGFVMEKMFKFFGIIKPEPPMTRFVATQLAKNHYFSHEKAKKDFGYKPLVSIEEGLELTFKN